MWRVTNTKKIYREVSGKLCVGRSWREEEMCSQLKGSRPPVRVSEPPLGHMLAVGVGCTVVRDGRSVKLGKDRTYEFQQTQQNVRLLSVPAGSSSLPSGLSHGTGRAKMGSRWKERTEAQLRRNYKNWPFYSLVGPCQPLQFFLWQGSMRMI